MGRKIGLLFVIQFTGKFKTTTVCSSHTSLISFCPRSSLSARPRTCLPLLCLKRERNSSSGLCIGSLWLTECAPSQPRDSLTLLSRLRSGSASSCRAFPLATAKAAFSLSYMSLYLLYFALFFS